jgi:hypothetical protein
MSARAALIARSVAVAVLFTFLAASGSQLVVVLAFALPFWIALEIEARYRPTPAPRLFGSSVIPLPSFERRSHPPTDHPKAA